MEADKPYEDATMTRTRKFSKSVWLFALAVFLAAPSFGQDPDQKPAQAPEFLVPAGTVMPIVLNENDGHDCYYEISTSCPFSAIRLAIVEGLIKPEEVEFYFRGKIIKINRFGAITDWPDGFCDIEGDYAEKILRKAVAMRKAERNSPVK